MVDDSTSNRPQTQDESEAVEFSPEQVARLGHWLSECLDDAAPLNERLWVGRAEWMVKGPTFQAVLREVIAERTTRPGVT